MEFLWNLPVDAFTEISCTVPFIPIWELLQTKRYHVAMKSQLPTMRCSVQEQHLFWISNQLLIDCFQRFSENPGQQCFKNVGCCSAESRGEGLKDFGFGDMAFWTRYQISPSSCFLWKNTMQCISINNNTHGLMMSLSCSWVGSWRFGQLHDNFYHQHGRTSSLPAALGVPTGIVCQLLDQSLLHRLPGNCPVPRSWLNLIMRMHMHFKNMYI